MNDDDLRFALERNRTRLAFLRVWADGWKRQGDSSLRSLWVADALAERQAELAAAMSQAVEALDLYVQMVEAMHAGIEERLQQRDGPAKLA